MLRDRDRHRDTETETKREADRQRQKKERDRETERDTERRAHCKVFFGQGFDVSKSDLHLHSMAQPSKGKFYTDRPE